VSREDRKRARRELGPAAVLRETEAAALLPCGDSVARGWLRDQGLVRHHRVLGRIVVWGDVLEAIRRDGEPVDDEQPTRRPPSGLERRPLRSRRRQE
jgi:hypothetical protein